MTADIAKRLRRSLGEFWTHEKDPVIQEAADQIERMRDQLTNACEGIERARAEIDRLRALVRALEVEKLRLDAK